MRKRLAIEMVIVFVLLNLLSNDHAQTNAQARQTPQSQQPAKHTAPVVVQNSGSGALQHDPSGGKDETGPRRVWVVRMPEKDRYDYWAFAATIALAIVGFLGVLVGVCTLRYLRKQAEESAKATKAAKDAADAALLNARALISAERPWIILEARVQKSGAFMFFVKNVGKTAAKITSVRSRVPVIVESLPDMPEYRPEDELLTFPALLPPGEERYVGDFSFEDFKVKNPQWASSVQFGGGKSLYICGRVQYLAMPEMPEGKDCLWETRYCRWYVPMEIPMFVEGRCPDQYNEYK